MSSISNDLAGSRRAGEAPLAGKVALVTGSSRGIGRAVAAALAEAGARVGLNGRDRVALERTAGELAAEGADVQAFPFDVRDEGEVRAAIDAVESTLGPVAVLVNCAGIQHRTPLLDLSVEDWQRVIDINLTGTFLVARAVARGMVARGEGKIINIASVQADLARPGIAPYTAAKGGVRNLTRAMAAEWSPQNVQVNAIAPGYLATEMTEALRADPEFDAWVVQRTPARRWGTAEDVVGAALWLAGPGSSFVTGQTIFVDGGMSVVV